MTIGDDTVDPDAMPVACALPDPEAASSGAEPSLAAQRCNVSGSMGNSHWFRLLGALPSGEADIIQLELWPNLGAFAGDVPHSGTFTIAGDDATYGKCGVCLRAVGKHGDTTNQMLYFATAGTVVVTSVGDAPTTFSAEISNATFEQVDADGVPTGTCTSTVPNITVTGEVVNVGGTGGMSGGGGGTGANGCKKTVGDL